MDKKIKDDMDILKFGRLISMITIDTPISIEFDNNYGQKKDRWWTSQREHLTVWCLHQPTQGIDKFKHKQNDSARSMYNESITLFAFFVELKEKKQSRWLFQSQICRIWAS